MSPHTIGGEHAVDVRPDDPGAGGIDLRDLLSDDAPPWLVALVAVLAFLLATSVMWGPAPGAYLRALVPTRERKGSPIALAPSRSRRACPCGHRPPRGSTLAWP